MLLFLEGIFSFPPSVACWIGKGCGLWVNEQHFWEMDFGLALLVVQSPLGTINAGISFNNTHIIYLHIAFFWSVTYENITSQVFQKTGQQRESNYLDGITTFDKKKSWFDIYIYNHIEEIGLKWELMSILSAF